MNIRRHLQKSHRSCSRGARIATKAAGPLVLVLMLAQLMIVLLRYVFSLGFTWGLDLLSYLFMSAALLPLFTVLLEDQNLRVDILYQDWSESTQTRLDRIGLFFMLIPVCVFVSWISWPQVDNSWRLLEASPTLGGLPGYYLLKTLQLLCFAGMGLLGLIMLLQTNPWNHVKTALDRKISR